MRAADGNRDAEAFRLDGDRRGVLLVHGFTGTPFEMRPLGDHLAARGYSVVGPRLAGHAGSVADLGATRWQDWLRTVEEAFDELRARTDAVVVVGLSMGGLLTLELARRRREELRAIVLLASALRLQPFLERLIRWAGRSRWMAPRAFPKWGGSDIRDVAMRKRNPSSPGFPVGALNSLLDLAAHAGAHLGEVDRPALVAHARRDHTIPFAAHAQLLAGLGAHVEEELVLERSHHVITLDVERELLFHRIESFLARKL